MSSVQELKRGAMITDAWLKSVYEASVHLGYVKIGSLADVELRSVEGYPGVYFQYPGTYGGSRWLADVVLAASTTASVIVRPRRGLGLADYRVSLRTPKTVHSIQTFLLDVHRRAWDQRKLNGSKTVETPECCQQAQPAT